MASYHMMGIHHMMEVNHMMEFHYMMEFHNVMEFHHIMEFHHMMEFHHIMDIHNFIWFVKSLAVLTTYWYKMSLVKPLFVASIASLTLMMTSISSTIDLLQQMGILPTLGTCCNCSSPTGAYKSEVLYNYFCCPTARRSSHCSRTPSSATATPPPSYVSVLQQPSHLQIVV